MDGLNPYLRRSFIAQGALIKGADLGTVQEMLGHTSNALTRLYAGHVRQTEAARQMPRFAPI
jgi:site-specific recombinase XerD